MEGGSTTNYLGEPLLADDEALLPPSTPIPAPQSETPTPLRYFFNDDTKDLLADDTEIGDPPAVTDEHHEQKLQLVALRILGKPFAKSFWVRDWPISALFGAVLSLCTLVFFAAMKKCLSLWFPLDGAPVGMWWWLIVTSLGGFGCGIFLLHPMAPNVGAVRTMFHDASDLKGHPGEAVFSVLACFVCLATGAPLGPEMAIGAMGSGLASLVAKLLKVDRRTEAAWVFSGMAGSLGALFPSPILGVILAHELSVVGRPNSLTLDAVVAKETKDAEEISQSVNHDFMEQVTLGGTAATCAYVVLHALPKSWQWNVVMEIGNDYHMWHLAVAIPLGVLCGFVASLALVFLGAFRSIRNKTCEILEERVGAPKWVGRLLFPTLAGALHGLLAVWNPMLVGSGVLFITNLIENHASMRPGWFLLMALSKALSMSLSLGFGLVGGPLIPMLYVGLCIGLACSFLVPISLAVPCCMCATVGAFVPIPFTLVVCAALALSLTVEQMGPVFVATMLAFACTGGLGVIRRMGERRLGAILGDDLMGFHEHPSDFSIVQGIRYTIFGNP